MIKTHFYVFLLILFFASGCTALDVNMQNTWGQMMEAPPLGMGVIAGHVAAEGYYNEKLVCSNIYASVSTVLHKENSFIPLRLSSSKRDGHFVWIVPPGKYRMDSLDIQLFKYQFSHVPMSNSVGIIEIKANEVLYIGHYYLKLDDGPQMIEEGRCGSIPLSSFDAACLMTSVKDELDKIKIFMAPYGYGKDFIFRSQIVTHDNLIEGFNKALNSMKDKLVVDKDGKPSLKDADTLYNIISQKSMPPLKQEQKWSALSSEMSPGQVIEILGRPGKVSTVKKDEDSMETWEYPRGSVTFHNGVLDIWRVKNE